MVPKVLHQKRTLPRDIRRERTIAMRWFIAFDFRSRISMDETMIG